MWILKQNGTMVNLDHCSTVDVGNNERTVMCYNDITPSGYLELGEYDTKDQCYDVIRAIFMALDESETFTMPSRDEIYRMYRTYQHKSHTQTSVSHGRS